MVWARAYKFLVFRAYSCAAYYCIPFSFTMHHVWFYSTWLFPECRNMAKSSGIWRLFFFVYDFCWGHAAALFFFFNFLGLDVLTSCLAASQADGRQFSYFAFSKLFHISEDFGVQPRALNSRMGSGNSMLLLSSRQKEKTKYQSTKFSKSMT